MRRMYAYTLFEEKRCAFFAHQPSPNYTCKFLWIFNGQQRGQNWFYSTSQDKSLIIAPSLCSCDFHQHLRVLAGLTWVWLTVTKN